MILKSFVFVICLLLLRISVSAQTPAWHWAKAGLPDRGGVDPRGVSTDAAGNVYATGASIALTNFTFGNIVLPPNTMFLVKYNKKGKLIWAKNQSINCFPKAISTDAAGNTYITGEFRQTVVFGTTSLVCTGARDIFVAKFDSAGNVLWARRAGGPGIPNASPPVYVEDAGTAIAVDSAGNCYIGGLFEISNFPNSNYNYVTFDTLTYSLPASMNTNKAFGFLAKYNAGGQIQWMRRIEAAKAEEAVKDIAISRYGNIFVTGTLYNSLGFNNLPTLTSNGSDDIYFAKFAPNGAPVWSRSFGGTGVEVPNAIAVDDQEQCYLTGYFHSQNLPIGAFNLTGSQQQGTVFIVKSNSSGNIAWAAQNTGSGSIGDSDIALDLAGNVFVSASFTGTVNIGSQTHGASNVTSGSLLVSKWSNTGSPLWAVTPQGKGVINRIAVDQITGECYLSGVFDGTTTFGSHFVTANGTSSGLYIAKLSSQPTGIKEHFSSEHSVYPNPTQQ